MTVSIRILLADDHPVVRMGLRAALAQYTHCQVIAEAATAAEAIRLAAELKPDVAVLDIRLPDRTGIEACREIRELSPSTQVVILTAYADDNLLFGAILAGASGYVLKHYGCDSLLTAIEAAARGQSVLDPHTTAQVLGRVRAMAASGGVLAEGMTEQERKVLAMLAQGRTNREMAEQLFVSVRTVKSYVSSILGKLGLRNRSEAAAFAARSQWGES